MTTTDATTGGTARETVAVAPIGNRVFKPIQPAGTLNSSNTGRSDSPVNTTSSTVGGGQRTTIVGGGQRTTIASPHVKRTASQAAALNSQLAKNKDALNNSQKLKQSSKVASAIDLTADSKKITSSSSVVNSASALKVSPRQEPHLTAPNNPTSRQGGTVIEEESEDEEKSVTNGKAINKPSSSSKPPSS